MKTAFAIAALAAIATAAAQDPMSEISAHWDQLTAIINKDLPALKLTKPELYASATKIIGGTEITQSFNTDLVQQVATGIDTALMNAVLKEAGITDITLDGKPIPTGAPAPTSAGKSSEPATTPAPTSAASSDASSKPQESSKPATSAGESSKGESSKGEESESESGKSEEESENSSESSSSHTSGAAKVIAGAAAAVVAVAALF